MKLANISVSKNKLKKTKDAYYDMLEQSDIGCHEETNNLTLFIKYMLQMVLACYVEFEERVGMMSEKGVGSTAYDIVKAYMMGRIGKMTSAEVIAGCPSVGRSAILGAIKRLTDEGFILKLGSDRGTYYVRADAVEE